MSGRRVKHTNQDHKRAGGSIPQAGRKCEELEEGAGFCREQHRVVILSSVVRVTQTGRR